MVMNTPTQVVLTNKYLSALQQVSVTLEAKTPTTPYKGLQITTLA